MKAITSARGIGPLPDFVDRWEGSAAAARIFTRVGLPVELSLSPDQMMPLHKLAELYEAAACVTGNSLFGFQVGLEMTGKFGCWVDYARCAPDLHTCLQRASRTLGYHQTGTRLVLTVGKTIARYSYILPGLPRAHAQHVEHALPSLLRTFRQFTGPDWKPLFIETDQTRSRRIDALEQALSIPVHCDCPATAVVFPARLLNSRSHRDMPRPRQIYLQDLRTMVRKRAPEDFENVVRELIHTNLLSGRTDAASIADSLGIGLRTFQRRLAKEDLCYRSLLTDVRLEKACALLTDSDMQVSEIAFLSGYSEQSHLARAFRRKLQMPPGTYRQKVRARSGSGTT